MRRFEGLGFRVNFLPVLVYDNVLGILNNRGGVYKGLKEWKTREATLKCYYEGRLKGIPASK